MNSYTKSAKRGFTIVELLIVIVIIAILAAITIVAYNGVQSRAHNAAQLAEMNAWSKGFKLYHTTNNAWPSALSGNPGYCLGTGYPVGAGGVPRCRDVWDTTTGYLQSDGTLLSSQLSSVMSIPSSKKRAVNNTQAGPYIATIADDKLRLTGIFEGGSSDCPNGTNFEWSSPPVLWCNMIISP